MDPLSDVLSLFKPRTYVKGGLSAGDPWSIHLPAYEGIKCYTVVAGECWLAVEGAEKPVRLRAGNGLLLPHGRPFVLAQFFRSWQGTTASSRSVQETISSSWKPLRTGGRCSLSAPCVTADRHVGRRGIPGVHAVGSRTHAARLAVGSRRYAHENGTLRVFIRTPLMPGRCRSSHAFSIGEIYKQCSC